MGNCDESDRNQKVLGSNPGWILRFFSFYLSLACFSKKNRLDE